MNGVKMEDALLCRKKFTVTELLHLLPKDLDQLESQCELRGDDVV